MAHGMQILFFAALLSAGAAGASSAPHALFLAPDGNDADRGTSAGHPLATLERARDLIRAARRAGDTNRWSVSLAPGRYERTATFALTAEDRDTRYCGKAGETIVSGGCRLNNWRDEGSNVWSAPVLGLSEGAVYFEQLFVNGRRAVRARWPKLQTDWNFGEKRQDFLTASAVREVATTNANHSITYDQFVTARGHDLDVLAAIPSNELRYASFVIHCNWDSTRRLIFGFDSASGTLHLTGAHMKHWNPWCTNSLFYVENVRSAFTQPGEWFLDKLGGRVYYRPLPGEKREASTFEAPRNGLSQLVTLNGCSGLTFEGLTFAVTDSPSREAAPRFHDFEHQTVVKDAPGPTQVEPAQAASTLSAALLADGISRCVFRACTIRETGEYGLWLRAGCLSNTVERCRLEDTGAGGLRLSMPSGQTPSRFNTVADCEIHQGGRSHAAGVGIWIGDGTDNIITHNHIADYFYTGISIGWNWGYHGRSFTNEISYNLIEKIGQAALGDLAGIYTLGTQTGTRIVNNVIRNVDSFTYGGWGIYPDEGSENLTIANNLVYDTKDGSFHQHYGKLNIVSNNLFACSREAQVCISRIEEHTSARFIGNIIYWDRPVDAFARYRAGQAKADWSRNLWWCTSGEPRFGDRTFTQWQIAGHDRDGIVMDPLFVDPAHRDFHFKSDSAWRLIGFAPFAYEQAGIRN